MIQKRSKISDVAHRAGVSISTVSRVLNGTAPVAEDTIERVMEAVSALNYRPHAAARVLASQKTNTIGLVLPEISGSFFPPMLRGIELGVRDHGYDLLIHATSLQSLEPGRSYTLGEQNTDGLLIFTDSFNEREIRRLYDIGFPILLLHRTAPEDMQIPIVTFENKSGARKLVNHLARDHGYRRIAFLQGPEDNEDSFWREMGYREALAENGIPFDETLIGIGAFNSFEAGQMIGSWLTDGLSMDAIFAGDDDSAAGVITALTQAGVRVPEEVAVVGFDDVPLSRYLTPALTTVSAPIELAGREAVRQLINLIENNSAEPLTLLPTELVIRQSCGCSRHT